MTKVAIITDTHIGLGIREDLMYKTLNSYVEDMRELKPDLIIHLGDVFHNKRPQSNAIEFATTFFTELSLAAKSLIVLAGGHDMDGRNDMTAIDFLDDLSSNITVITEPTSLDSVLFLPYTRYIDKEVLDLISQHSLVFMHQGIVEAPLDTQGRIYGRLGDAVPLSALSQADLVVCGHIHTPWATGKVLVPGSPYPTRRGANVDKRYYPVFTLEDVSDMELIEFRDTFWLKKLKVEYVFKNTRVVSKDIMKLMPAIEANTYYSIELSVEGTLTKAVYDEIKNSIQMLYKDALDDLSIISVLPRDQRDTMQHIKHSLVKYQDNLTPVSLMEVWLNDTKRKAFFEANPALRDSILSEINDITSKVDAGILKNINKASRFT